VAHKLGASAIVVVLWLFAGLTIANRSLAAVLAPSTLAAATEEAPSELNSKVYYKNKLETSYDTGCLFLNTPLLLGPVLGYAFHRKPRLPHYIIVPNTVSLRWHLDGIRGRSFWRGNTDFTIGGSYQAIVHGPESYYAAVIGGLRYNFVQPEWKLAPYAELRGGFGWTDAAQPYQVAHNEYANGQGQDFTFTVQLGTGVRYNFNSRYSVSTGIEYLHISNGYLSEPKYYNHAVNVAGPVIGVNVAL
jgi:hypothetical protein